MKKNRRDFIKKSGILGLTMTSGLPLPLFSEGQENHLKKEVEQSIIGQYGTWAIGLNKGKLPQLSFRNDQFTDLESWRKIAMEKEAFAWWDQWLKN